MISKRYTSPLQVAEDGTIVNPEPDAIVVDGIEYVRSEARES